MNKRNKNISIVVIIIALLIGVLAYYSNNSSTKQNSFFVIGTSCPSGTTTPYCSGVDSNAYFQCSGGLTYRYPCDSGKYCSNGQCIFQSCPSGTTTPYCSSLDPNGYYQCSGGITNHYTCPSGKTCSNGQCISTTPTCPSGTTTPYCSSIDTNGYFQCNPSTGKTDHYSCSSGETCSNGQCVKSNPIPLTCPSGTTTPYCSSINPNAYFQCSDGITYNYACPSGKTCSNGQCISTTPTCPSGTTTPYCSSIDTNGYFQCNPSTGKTDHYSCSSGETCSNGQCVANTCPPGTTNPYCSALDFNGYFQCNPSTGKTDHYKCTDTTDTCVQDVGCQGTKDRTDCTEPLSDPYCSSLDPNGYYQRCGQLTLHYSCRSGYQCSDGSKCFHEGAFPSGDTLDDLLKEIKNKTETVIDDLFGKENKTEKCQTCNQWLLNKIGLKQCEPTLFNKITLGLFESLSCSIFFVKIGIIVLFTFIMIFVNKKIARKMIDSEGGAWFSGIVTALIMGFILYITVMSILFYIVLAMGVILLIISIFIKGVA